MSDTPHRGHTPLPWRRNKYGSIGAGETGAQPIVASVEPFYGSDREHGDHSANLDLIVASVNSHYGLIEALAWALPLAERAVEEIRGIRCQAGHGDTIQGTYSNGVTWCGIYQTEVDEIERARAALKAARGQS